MAEVVVTEADKGGAKSLAGGDTLVVQIDENPTTGFRWTEAQVGETILELQDDAFQLASPAAGSGGLRIFRFLAKSPGSTRLELRLKRSWESAPPREVFELNVTVS